MEQPKADFQKMLDEVLEATPVEVEFCGKKRRIGWLRHYAQRKFTHIMLGSRNSHRSMSSADEPSESSQEPLSDEEIDSSWKRNVQLVSVLLLGRKWKIIFFHWLYWRWLYYIKDVSYIDILHVLDACKKKVALEPCFLCTILAVSLMDTMMTMAAHERTQAVPSTAPDIA